MMQAAKNGGCPRPQKIYGVVGGMGPMASNEFLRTIYSYGIEDVEQSAPAVVMYSDPTVPDRTQALLRGEADVLTEHLRVSLESLRAMGADRIAVCCVTIHAVFPRLASDLRAHVVSLVDTAMEGVVETGTPQLLLCSEGTRKLEIFEKHPLWADARGLVKLPSAEDQAKISRVIYQMKRTGEAAPYAAEVLDLLAKYRLDSFISGCTEFHILCRHLRRTARAECRFIDPLESIARNWVEEKSSISEKTGQGDPRLV